MLGPFSGWADRLMAAGGLALAATALGVTIYGTASVTQSVAVGTSAAYTIDAAPACPPAYDGGPVTCDAGTSTPTYTPTYIQFPTATAAEWTLESLPAWFNGVRDQVFRIAYNVVPGSGSAATIDDASDIKLLLALESKYWDTAVNWVELNLDITLPGVTGHGFGGNRYLAFGLDHATGEATWSFAGVSSWAMLDDGTNTTKHFNVSHTTTGTAATGLGTGLKLQGEDAAGNAEDFGTFECALTDATNGSEDTTCYVKARAAGAGSAAVLTVAGTGDATVAGDATVQGGDLNLTNNTSNFVIWQSAGLGAPARTTRSAGTKTVLYPSISGSQVDFAQGIAASEFWQSVSASGSHFSWYADTTEVAQLSGTGGLQIDGTLTASGIAAGAGKAACLKTNGVLGYCSSAVGADGTCTCN